MDERRDPGEFYPGGRVIGRPDVAPPQGRVRWSDIQDKPETMPPSEHAHPASQVSGLSAVATSGSYNDLQDKPPIPAIDDTLTTQGAAADAKATGDALALRPTKADMDEGWWSEWAVIPSNINSRLIVAWSDAPLYSDHGGWYVTDDRGDIVTGTKGARNSSQITWSVESDYTPIDITATRHRVAAPVPTSPEDIGAAGAQSVATDLARVDALFDAIGEALDDIIANVAVATPVSVDLYARAPDTGKYHKVTVAKENGAVVGLEVDDVEVTR